MLINQNIKYICLLLFVHPVYAFIFPPTCVYEVKILFLHDTHVYYI